MTLIWTMFIAMFLSFAAYAGVGAYQSTTNLGVFGYIKCSTGLTCTKQGDKLNIVSSGGGGQTPVLATATTITSAQCGSLFYNSGAVAMKLPLASTVLGCSYTFVTLNASNFDVNPDDADQILVLTNAVGDAIRNATLGNAIVLKAVGANKWVQLGGQGTWTDIN